MASLRTHTACGDIPAGNIDHMFEVLKRHKHPFILVGPAASRWMGSRGCFDEAFDLVLRNHQLTDIVRDLIQTGHWTVFNAREARRAIESRPLRTMADVKELSNDQLYRDHASEADVVLDRLDQCMDHFARLRLWSEDSYHIKVDECPLIDVPDLYARNPFLVEETYHPTCNRDDGWWYGPDTLTNTCGHQVFLPELPRGKSPGNTSPIFVPSIPAFLDALADQKRMPDAGCMPTLAFYADWQIRNLTRYLYLELPHQRDTILFEVEARNEVYLNQRFAHYKRKPFIVCDTETRQLVEAYVWDPDSYPESIRKRREKAA